jgi:hypothetical protein
VRLTGGDQLPGAACSLPYTEQRKRGSVERGSGGRYTEAAEGEGEEQLRLRREGVGSLGVRIARQRMPRLPRVVAARPNSSAGELLEGREGSGAGQWGLASAGKGTQGCGGATHGQRQSSRTGEGEKQGRARGRGGV